MDNNREPRRNPHGLSTINELNKSRGNSTTESMRERPESEQRSPIRNVEIDRPETPLKQDRNTANNYEQLSFNQEHSRELATPSPKSKNVVNGEQYVRERGLGSTNQGNPPADLGEEERDEPEIEIKVERWKCVCERLRLSCCLLCSLLALASLLVVILWFTIISKPHHLLEQHTAVEGLALINHSNTLIQGGAEVTLNLSTVPETIENLRARIYYGPEPSREDYVSLRTHTMLSFNATNYKEFQTDPFIFEMATENGSFDYIFYFNKPPVDTQTILVTLNVYNSYENALKRDGQCSIEMYEIDAPTYGLTYNYTSTGENCKPSRPSSYYGINRYFTIQVNNNSYTEPNVIHNLTLSGNLIVRGSSLNSTFLTHNFVNCSPPDKKIIKCFAQYLTFVDEINANNTILLNTFIDNRPSVLPYPRYTSIALSITETVRGPDIVGLMVGIVVLLVLIVLLMYICPTKERRKVILEHPCTCLFWCVRHHRVRRTYTVLVGSH